MLIRTAMSLVFFLALTVGNVNGLRAQSGTRDALTGAISDVTGSVLPNATVKVAVIDTAATRTAHSDADGRFLFAQLLTPHWTVGIGLGGNGLPRLVAFQGRIDFYECIS